MFLFCQKNGSQTGDPDLRVTAQKPRAEEKDEEIKEKHIKRKKTGVHAENQQVSDTNANLSPLGKRVLKHLPKKLKAAFIKLFDEKTLKEKSVLDKIDSHRARNSTY